MSEHETATRELAVGRVLEELIEANRMLLGPRVTPLAGQELSRSHLEALFLIAHRDNVTPGALASSMRITAGAVTQLLAKLRRAGLVVAAPTLTDSRSITLTLTGSAEKELTMFEAQAVEQSMPHFERLTTADLESLSALLSLVTVRS
ncbi:DNA-binding MarR family transcriptional regulator [Salinibacterium sp. CAN_S4]|uniref:MarR family winged helix-turn-helix transcriptional regulator n=1 Tax=Salinibacterium sp. CAN_S4 TaxID=2787727 RepID=UPI0018EF7699